MIKISTKFNDFVYLFPFSTFQIYNNFITLLRLIVRVGGSGVVGEGGGGRLNCQVWGKNPLKFIYIIIIRE